MLIFGSVIFISIFFLYLQYNDYKSTTEIIRKNNYKNYCNLLIKLTNTITNQYGIDLSDLHAKIKDSLKKRVFLGYSLIQSIYYDNKDANTALKLLKLIKFDNGRDGYVVLTANGKFLWNAYYPDLTNKTVEDIKDDDLKNGYGKMINLLDKKSYIFYTIKEKMWKVQTDKYKKLYFGIKFAPLKWYILTGDFLYPHTYELNRIFLKKIKNWKNPDYVYMCILNKDKARIFSSLDIKSEKILKLISEKKLNTFVKTDRYTFYSSKIDDAYYLVTFFDNKNIEANVVSLKKRMYQKFQKKSFFIIVVLLMILLIFYFIFRKFKENIDGEFNKIVSFFKNVPDSNNLLDLDNIYYEEFTLIGKSSNMMIEKIRKLNRERENFILKLENEKVFLNTILSSVQEGIAVIGKDDLIIEYMNKFALTLTKYNDTIIGKSLKDIISEEKKLNRLNNILTGVIETKKIFHTDYMKLYKSDGTFFPADITFVGMEINNKIDKFLIVFRDISKELEFKNEILRFKKAIESSPVSIMITDNDCHIEYINPFFTEITGYTFEEVIGKKPSIVKTEYNERFYGEIFEQINNGEVWQGELLNRKKNGDVYWEQAIISPIIDEKGRCINFVGIKIDITERKNLFEELRKEKERAEAANMAKSEFLANMSHEIRTPMNAILGFIQLLHETTLDKTQQEYLQIIETSSQNLLGILNDILDLAKIESGKMTYSENTIALRAVVKSCVETFRAKIKEKGLKFIYNIDENVPDNLIGDDLRISQVINNLLSNAVKFTEKGYIKIDCTLKSTDKESVIVKITVEDTGIGIPEHKLTDIFNDFSQADASITRKFGGTGLGLTISKAIVENYNGTITVESKEGEGSRFIVEFKLKLSDKTPVEIFENKSVDRRDYNNVNVLIVEDNQFNYELLNNILNLYKIQSDIAINGFEALEKLNEKDYSLVFMDWHMPDMDGVETIHIIRSFERGSSMLRNDIPDLSGKLKGKHLYVICLTAAAMTNEVEYLKEQGFDDYLSKPFKIKELELILQKYLSHDECVDTMIDISESSDNSGKILDYSYLESLFDGDKNVVENVVSSFKETCEKSLLSLKESIKSNDLDEIKIIAHTLKGAAGNIGATKIMEISKRIENKAKEENVETIKESIKKLENYIKEI